MGNSSSLKNSLATMLQAAPVKTPQPNPDGNKVNCSTLGEGLRVAINTALPFVRSSAGKQPGYRVACGMPLKFSAWQLSGTGWHG